MPRYEFRMPRVFVPGDLHLGQPVTLGRAQAHYLRSVMRVKDGGDVLLFNGRDGEWRARLDHEGRKDATAQPAERTREQTPLADLHYLFAPLKQGRLDYMVQKAVEMGVSRLIPVLTQQTQVRRVNVERLRANVTEAAEQCGILALPVLDEPTDFAAMLRTWDEERRLVFCDEGSEGQNPLPALTRLTRGPLAVLVGPEGGFSEEERDALHARAFVTAIPLGPRVLRADTAAVAALTVVQATLGDWC